MGFYETTYILHSALQEGRLKDILNTIEKKIESLGAKILFIDNWGRKKLSYLIQKEKYGTYIFFQYKIKDIKNIKELNSEFQHNPNILRHLTIEIEEKDILEKKEEEIIETKKKIDKDISPKINKKKDEKIIETKKKIDKDISPKINKKKDEKIDNVTEEQKTEPTESEKEE